MICKFLFSFSYFSITLSHITLYSFHHIFIFHFFISGPTCDFISDVISSYSPSIFFLQYYHLFPFHLFSYFLSPSFSLYTYILTYLPFWNIYSFNFCIPSFFLLLFLIYFLVFLFSLNLKNYKTRKTWNFQNLYLYLKISCVEN